MIKKASELNPGDRFVDPYHAAPTQVKEVLPVTVPGRTRFELTDVATGGWWITSWDEDTEVTMIED